MQSNIPEPTAVIGTACRFPGASSPARLWELLKNPKDLLRDIPPTRFNTAGFYRSNGGYHGATNVTKSYLLDEDHRTFDASFFNISPREAEAMDPQQRLLLEVVHETTESAGYTLGALAGSDTSVFVGVMSGDYHELQLRDVGSLPQHLATGTARSILSNRISYFFDWRGPSMTIDTACSSSLVAVHQAIGSLQQGSQVAIVAGANLLLGPEAYIFESKLRMLSPTGRSRMWDASADGYARGEGFAAVMLKPLSKALQDGDAIECVIRASCVNQDGNSSAGITAPTAAAQIALIQKTYAAAGLDPRNPRDRCQYFEAHGTGTPTGDPIEAEAISRAFFSSREVVPTDQRMHVGSIKTIVGHLEGTAGLAGLIKASLMVQHGIIPPNLLFETLNPSISPFYTNLRVPTVATKLPDPEPGSPRRVSVNSFGFGGTNAHVIVESFWQEHPEVLQDAVGSSSHFVSPLPLVLSAKSDSSLRKQVVAMRDYLKQHPHVSLMDLAWTSIFNRTLFPYRVTFAAGTTKELLESLARKAAEMEGAASSLQPVTSAGDLQPRILGVFTGQGAQWPQMGLYLYTHCPSFAVKIRELDQVLADLPDAPAWTLEDALKQDEETSHIHSAVISQPICTAVQLALVDLCCSAGLVFSTIIGHSSGEIAAAYAADIITAREAISIAYYRGLHSHLAAGVEHENGGMMATGLTLSQGKVFCAQDQWTGRLVVAAENGPGSTTLSGDEDAIVEAADALKRENIFCRVLRVEKAYHSHHMLPCAGPCLKSLRECRIRPRDPTCTWISTVHVAEGSREGVIQTMDGRYWVENMERPVLFRQGLQLALRAEASLDFALEIGPHPALSGPWKQTMKGVLGQSIPYHGTLSRGCNDSEAISSMLGFVIANSSSLPRNLRRYPDLFQGIPRPRYLRDFPTYSWDHSTVFWKESRTSQRFRSRDTGIHDLLGSRMPDDNKDAMRWSNILRANELPWTSGHRFQNQILFPAAGYILMAVEAALALAQGAQVDAVTLHDLQILNAITLEEASSGVETMFALTKEAGREDSSGSVHARFTLYAETQQNSSEMVKHFSGGVTVILTTSAGGPFPQRERSPEYLLDVDVEQFYEAMSRVGLDYTGTFRGVTSMRRKSRLAQTEVMHVGYAEGATNMAMHPGFMDACLQGLLGAYAAPNDGSFWTAYLPTAVRKAHFNLRSARPTDQSTSFVDSYITRASAQDLEGDVEAFDAQGGMRFQLEGVVCTAIEPPSPTNDRRLFAKVAWKCDCPSSMEVQPSPSKDVADIRQLAAICERYSYMYLKKLRSQIGKEEEASLKWHLRQLLAFTDFTLPRLEQGRCPTYDPKWVNDTEDVLDVLASPFADEVDIQIIRAVGSNLVEFFRETKMPLEVLQQNDMLSRQYIEGMGFNECNIHVGRIASQIVHRYPNMRILEIGAGTGATTRAMSDAMGDHYDEYFYTDVSAGFFERAKPILNSDKATYKILNIEGDPVPQGFEPHSFDLIVASNVLHATRVLKTTLENVRKLLRPGGYLLLMEITGEWLRNRLPISCLPGWWLGADDGRPHGATVTEGEWNNLLLRPGFSGIDRVERDAVDGEVFSPAMIEESMQFSQMPAIVRNDSSDTLWRSINAQVQAAPDDIAIKDGYGTHMSYRSFGRRVREIIAQMREETIEPLSPVAVLCEPSAEAICALLAIWAYPAICVPMDLSNPVPRIDAVIRECKPSGILFHSKSEEVVNKVHAGGASLIDVGFRTPDGEDDREYKDRRHDYMIDPESLALILYTSGTTGRPKGVTISHLNLVTCISGMQERLALGKEVVLQQSSLGFDLSIAQVAVALTGGGTLVISRREQRGDALELSRLLCSEDVTFTFCVPSEYSVLLRFGHADLQHCRNWRFAISAGERLTTQLKGEFRKLNCGVELVNAYGPAETTIISHLSKIHYHEDEGDEFVDTNTSGDILHVGPPLPYYLTFIMDDIGRPVPLGFPGEVYIGGLGVSPGYHNMEEVTRQKFLENPYCDIGQNRPIVSMRRLYRSGDRGRMLADGSLVPLGRIDGDQQIKLRGMRVDLESIESSVVTISRGVIREAVVVQRGDPAFLACFVIFNGTEAPANADDVCRNILIELPEPEYMRPTVFVPLSEFPRNTNGKVDRAAMKNMVIQRERDRPDSAYDEELTASECVLRSLWLQLLSHDKLAPLRIFKSTDFFAVGGSSLLLVELQNSISNEFHVIIPLKDLFASSSLEGMVRRISRESGESGESTARNPTFSIDWDLETAIEKEVMDLKSSIQELTRTKMPGEGLRVVLSGAFGYLGNAILADLVANPAVFIVVCIATRRRSNARTYDVPSTPEHLSKIKIQAGDLSDPLLGLSETLFHELSGSVDAIIHNGADVSFLKDYPSLRAVNLTSTKVLSSHGYATKDTDTLRFDHWIGATIA